MKPINVPYDLELDREEAQKLYDAEETLCKMLDNLPEKDLGKEYNKLRKSILDTYTRLSEVNSRYNVHVMCDPDY